MFTVNTERLASAFAGGCDCPAKVSRAGDQVSACAGSLSALGNGYAGICSSLRRVQGELIGIAGALEAWFTALDEIRGLYEKTERDISGFDAGMGSSVPGAAAAAGPLGASGSAERSRKVYRRGEPVEGPVSPDHSRTVSVKKVSEDGDSAESTKKDTGESTGEATEKGTGEAAEGSSGSISAGARKQLLSAGITDQQIDEWEKEGLSLTAKEAQQYLPLLLAAAAGYKSVSREEFKEQISEQLSEEDFHAAASGSGNPARQAEVLNKAAGVLLTCYPSAAMTVNRKVEVPAGPGISMYCEVSGTGKGVSNNSVKVSETLNAHTGMLKEGISISTEGGSVSFTETGRSLTFNTDAGKLKTDGSSISWSVSGDISDDTRYSLQIKVNAQTGETVCEESLTTKVEKADITTAIGLKAENKPTGPVPMPGCEEAVKSRERAQAIEGLLISAMAPDLLGDTEAILEGLGLLSLQTAGR